MIYIIWHIKYTKTLGTLNQHNLKIKKDEVELIFEDIMNLDHVDMPVSLMVL